MAVCRTAVSRAQPAILPDQRALLRVSAACLIAIAALGCTGVLSGGWQALWDSSRRPAIAAMYRLFEAPEERAADPYPGDCRFRLAKDMDDTTRFDTIQARLLACGAAHGPGVAVLGDSHADDLFSALRSQSDTPFLVSFARRRMPLLRTPILLPL